MAEAQAAEHCTAQQTVEEDKLLPAPRQISCCYCSCNMPLASKFCPECGRSLQAETNIWKVCPSCDAVIPDDAIFCSACREKFPENFLQ